MPVDPNEPTYCLCHQVSYGEMIGCDNPDVSERLYLNFFYYNLAHEGLTVFTVCRLKNTYVLVSLGDRFIQAFLNPIYNIAYQYSTVCRLL